MSKTIQVSRETLEKLLRGGRKALWPSEQVELDALLTPPPARDEDEWDDLATALQDECCLLTMARASARTSPDERCGRQAGG